MVTVSIGDNHGVAVLYSVDVVVTPPAQLRQETEPDVLEEELITLDAVGCFEGEQNYRRKARGREEKEEANREEERRKQGEEIGRAHV